MKEQKNNTTIIFHYIWCDILKELINNQKFYKNVNHYLYLNARKQNQYNVFLIYYQIFTKLLLTNNNIKYNVNKFLNKFNHKYIGIQIRKGNAELKEKPLIDVEDIHIMLSIANKSLLYKKWYVTGDSQRIKLYLSRMYDQIFIYSTNQTKHYAKYPKDYNVIIEHEILSKSNMIIISKSTYGLTAILKSGLLLHTEKHLCYEIKNKRIFNVYNEFNNFHK